MKNTLEQLWDSYLMENPVNQNTERKKLLDTLVRCEDTLRASLTPEQINALGKYDACLLDISTFDQKEAFTKGVRFATGYLLDVLYFGV